MFNLFDFDKPKQGIYVPVDRSNTLLGKAFQGIVAQGKEEEQAIKTAEQKDIAMFKDLVSKGVSPDRAKSLIEKSKELPVSRQVGEAIIGAANIGKQFPRYAGNIGGALGQVAGAPYEASKALFGEQAGLTSFLSPVAKLGEEYGAKSKAWGEGVTSTVEGNITEQQRQSRRLGADILSTSVLPAGSISKIGTVGQAIKTGAKIGAITTPQYTTLTEGRLPTIKEEAIGTISGAAISPALYGAGKTVSSIFGKKSAPVVSTVNKESPEEITKAGQRIQSQLKFTKPEREKIKNYTGQEIGDFIVKTSDDFIPENMALSYANRAVDTRKQVDNALSRIPGEYDVKGLSQMTDDLEKFLVSTEGRLDPANNKYFSLIEKYKQNGKLTIPEINEVKRAFEKNVKTGYFKEMNSVGIARSTNIDNAVREGLIEQVGDAIPNIRELNKQTRNFTALSDIITSRISQKANLNNISLTDWIVLAQTANNPQALSLLIGKKIANTERMKNFITKFIKKQEGIKNIEDQVANLQRLWKANNEKELNKLLLPPPSGKQTSLINVRGEVTPATLPPSSQSIIAQSKKGLPTNKSTNGTTTISPLTDIRGQGVKSNPITNGQINKKSSTTTPKPEGSKFNPLDLSKNKKGFIAPKKIAEDLGLVKKGESITMKNKAGNTMQLKSNNKQGIKMAENAGYTSLTEKDIRAGIKAYTKDNSNINKELRAGNIPKQVGAIDEYLNRQPNLEGKVYRGITLKESEYQSFIDKLKRIGLKDKAYISATENLGDATTFARTSNSNGTRGILFEIESKTGKKVDRSLNAFDEEEVLFKRGTQFIYDGEYIDKQKGTIIKLKER